MSEIAYAGARVTLLDREPQSLSEAMLYPITAVRLLGPDAQPVRTFVVDDDGHWVEVQ